MLQIITQLATTFLTVAENNDQIYRFAPLGQYPAKKRFIIRLADLGFYFLISAIGLTVRFSTDGESHLESITRENKLPVWVTWHDRIFLTAYYLRGRGIAFMTSQSFDGEYIARFIQRFGFGAVRGSSSRGGAKGLVQMIRMMRDGIAMGMTVDGPRGPRYVAKSGAVMLAKKTGNPLLPFVIIPRRYITNKSWDKLQIPMPFTSAVVRYGEPIYVPADGDDASDMAKLAELQSTLDRLASV